MKKTSSMNGESTSTNGSHLGDVAGPVDPFDGYFRNGAPERSAADSLLDHRAARQWFETLGWASQSGLYSYQQPFGGKSGPFVHLDGRQFVMMSSYDYLGLIGHPEIEQASCDALRKYGTGTGGVRLLTGSIDLHTRTERRLASFKETEAAVVFSSGYLANVGVIAALVEPRDRVVVDEKAHRSIADACRLAHVPTWRFEHNDVESLRRVLEEKPPGRRTLIVAEGSYSMDGDVCPLPELIAVKEQVGAFLMIDEAHSLGVYGASGRGIHEHFGVPAEAVDVWTGSLSKAVPSNGGFVAGKRDLIYYLQHGAAPFFFSAAVAPAAVAAAEASLRVLHREPERLERLWDNTRYLRRGLNELGYGTPPGDGPIVPVVTRDFALTLQVARALFDRGVITSAVVYPAVPHGSARLRLCATARHSRSILDRVLDSFDAVSQLVQAVA